jgi:hypothetical protein
MTPLNALLIAIIIAMGFYIHFLALLKEDYRDKFNRAIAALKEANTALEEIKQGIQNLKAGSMSPTQNTLNMLLRLIGESQSTEGLARLNQDYLANVRAVKQ